MESINLDLNDVLDRGGSYASDEDVGHMPENSGNVGEAENDIIANLSKLSKGAARKRVSNPRLKLDVDRLKSSRGLPAIPKIFKNIHFGGKGHEIQDLELLMSTLEHWGHRLMPKMPFEELTERLEKLGAKKEIQTCVKRIRLDLPFFNGEVQEDDEDVPANVSQVFDNSMTSFDNLISNNNNNNSTVALNDSTIAPDDSTSPLDHSVIFPSTPIVHNSSTVASSPTLTQEQKERIERNKRLALQKRMQRSLLATPS